MPHLYISFVTPTGAVVKTAVEIDDHNPGLDAAIDTLEAAVADAPGNGLSPAARESHRLALLILQELEGKL